ncbi:phosphomannomutase [Thiohalobacter sp. IOR34]|nr:phosphomannomutase [Thiohalobacter sp. IOR34]WJW76859.1 phosphomannomutase [Thiohalobacter sp. IOR34]
MADSGVGFGTSGARGRVADMTPPVCYAYTRAFLQHLEQAHGLAPGARVAIAGDLRPSTPRIMAAVARAVADAGYRPLNCGFIPSPAVALFGIEQGIPSVMVTGSHIPDDRNGIKFNTALGEILKEDEAGIRAQRVEVPEPFPADFEAALPAVDEAAARAYLRRYTDFLPADALAGMRVGVYQHSGVARDLLPELLAALGAEPVPLGRSEVFLPVDTEAIRPEDVELARQWAAEQDFDAIVSTDGDADRPLVGDERGAWLRGDVAGVLCARFLGIERLVTPVSSNSVVERCGWFESVDRTRIGSPYVIAGMQVAAAAGGTVAGYEANGGFLLATPVTREGRTLAALPTRDAVIVILALLVAAREQGTRLSGLVGDMPPRFTASDRLKDFPTEGSRACIARLLDEAGEGDTAAIEAAFGDLCGRVAATDTTDGLRITFENGEIVHLRPSGNAPEFRCYNEADSPQRAAELNRACLAVLEGWRQG